MAPLIAVVTGAAGGMGRAIVARLLADGLSVVGVDIDAGALAEMAKTRPAFEAEPCDLTDAGAISALFARIVARHGGIDALVNNAGTCLMSDFPDIPADELDRQMAINFSSAFHCCQGAVKAMLGRPGVRKIVNISSNGAYNFDVFDPPVEGLDHSRGPGGPLMLAGALVWPPAALRQAGTRLGRCAGQFCVLRALGGMFLFPRSPLPLTTLDPVRIAAGIDPRQAVASRVEIDEARRHVMKERPVVTDQGNPTGVSPQLLCEEGQPGRVQVVCRLVEEQEVRV